MAYPCQSDYGPVPRFWFLGFRVYKSWDMAFLRLIKFVVTLKSKSKS